MATLHVRNVPETLYQRIQDLAQKENRSVTAEVIQLLSQGLKVRETHRDASTIIERIQERARKVVLPAGWVDSVDLVRKDRSR